MKLEQCINYLLTGAQHKVFQVMKKELDVYDVTPIQHGVLKCLWEKDLHNPKEIAEKLGIENSTISGILERMEKKGLIVRSIDTNDRRYIRVDLTEEGRSLEKDIDQTVSEVNDKVLEGFSDKDIEMLKSLLNRLIDPECSR